MKRLLLGITILLIMFFSPVDCLSSEHLPWERFSLNLGGFVAGSDSSLRVGLPSVGVTIDLEEALRVDATSNVFRVDALWRFSKNYRHRLDFSWFRLQRKGINTLRQDIEIDGVVYPLGTTVDTTLNYEIYKTAYSYSYSQDDRIDMAVSAGLYIFPISFNISANGFLENETKENITALLPMTGLRVDFAITPKIFLKSRVDFFYLEYSKFKGNIVDVTISGEY